MAQARKSRSNTPVRGPLRTLIILGVVAALVGVAALVYVWVTGGSGEASAPISAPELAGAAVAPTNEAGAASGETVLYNIIAEESEVRFILDEDLRGVPTTVIGRTDQVAGQLEIDFANPANSRVGAIRINLRTLVTDNEFRNRAIRGQILRSSQDEFEFTEFTPTAVTGLPTEAVEVGEPIQFQIVGTLPLIGVENEVTFDVTATRMEDGRLQGTATSTVQRTAWGLEIPNVPGVANVSDDVQLEIDFVAAPA